jgi:hypothetical protein
MKTMTCKQLGGVCDKTFSANTFEEIGNLSEQHGIEMFKAGDKSHLEAMDRMRELMKKPEEMLQWYEEKRKEFDDLPED